MNRFLAHRVALCQIAGVVGIIVAIALWPPKTGAMVMIPLSGRGAGVIDVAVSGGAGLLAAGPTPGSMIVIGDRSALSGPALDRGILLLSAPRMMCGIRTGQGDAA